MIDVIVQAIGVVVGIVLIAAMVVGVSSWEQKLTMTLWLGFAAVVLIVLGFCLYLQGRIWQSETRPHPIIPDPFDITFTGQVGQNERTLSTFLMLKYYTPQGGQMVSPIHKMVMVRITNRQHVDSVIETYRAEIQTPRGDWAKLIRVDGASGVVVAVKDIKNARIIKFAMLDAVLGSHRKIVPGETVEGAALFELPDSVGPKPAIRIYVKDFGGAEMSKIIFPQNADSDFAQSWQIQFVGPTDLSNCAFVFWSESSHR